VKTGSKSPGELPNDLEYVGGGCLLLQCLLGLIEKTHVFNCDDRLFGEGAQQLNLPLRKWHGLCFANRDRAYGFAIAQHRNRDRGSPIASQRQLVRVLPIREHVGHMGDPAI